MDIICINCGVSFMPVGGRLKNCIDCRFFKRYRRFPVPRSLPTPRNQFKGVSPLIRRKYSMIKASARKRGLFFDLSMQLLSGLMSKPCYYCGVKEYQFSVDRFDNTVGYVDGNVVACCRRCNSRKRQMSGKLFINTCLSTP